MPDVDLLLLLVLFVYFSECLIWVPVTAVGFSTTLPCRWRRVRPARPNRSWDRGFVVSVPWPPLSCTVVCDPLPLVISPDGVGSSAREGVFWPWAEVRSTGSDGKGVTINGQRAGRTATTRLAVELARLVRELAPLSRQERTSQLQEFWDRRFALDQVKKRLVAHRGCVWPLRLWTNLFWLSLFVGVPLLIYTPLVVHWLPIVAAILVGWLITPLLFALTLRRHPGLERAFWPNGIHRFFVAASPLAALRAEDLVARELLGDLDPLAVSQALLPARHFAACARVALVDLEKLKNNNGLVGLRADSVCWQAGVTLQRLRGLLKATGVCDAELMAPPRRTDAGSVAYCPRCLAQYSHGEVCSSAPCQKTPLVAFENRL